MKRLLVPFLIFTFCLFFSLMPVDASSQFEIYMNDFYKNQKIASNLLKEIESNLKDGSRDKVCERQRKAAYFGIKASESLIKAFEINGSTTEMDDIKAGLDKWRELRDFC